MCGLVGMAGNGVTQNDMDTLRDLMRISTLRGIDGTGLLQGKWWISDPKHSWFIEKSTMEVNEFIIHHASAKEGNHLVLKDVHDNVFAGHVRWATKGELSRANTHPFDTGRLIGMHNGTLVDKQYDDPKRTDSELLLQDIDKNGFIPVLGDLDFMSAYAIVAVEKKTGILTFARNSHRPLFVCFNKHRGVMYWHSEEYALEYILKRNCIDYTEICHFKVNTLYQIHPSDITPGGCNWEMTEVPVKSVTPLPGLGGKKKKGYHSAIMDDYSEWGFDETGTWHYPGKTQEYYDSLEWIKDKGKILEFKKIEAKAANSDDIPPFDGPFKDAPVKKSPKIPNHKCLACNTPLTLADQFFANKCKTTEGDILFECVTCISLRNELPKDVHIN